MSRVHGGWQRTAAFTRLLIAALALSWGVGDARAESAQGAGQKPAANAPKKQKSASKKDKAQKAPAARGEGKAARAATNGAPSAAYVPIEKPDGSLIFPMRRTQMSDRMNAGIRRWEAEQARKQKPANASEPAGGTGGTGLRSALTSVMRLALAQTTTPSWADLPKPIEYFNAPNYAYSKLPTATCLDKSGAVVNDPTTGQPAACVKDADCPGYAPPIVVGVNIYPGGSTCTGKVQSGGLRKFVDSLALLCPQGKSTLNGNCVSVATPDTTTYSDADYYELGLKDFTWQFHTDLNVPTRVRGYYQKNGQLSFSGTNDPSKYSYLGPVIVAQTNRPVRMKLVNELPPGAAGDLFLPTDTVLEGAGDGPGGKYTNNRAAVHLHGGNTPWISDGTQHQWTAPVGQSSTWAAPYTGQDLKGWSVQDVPDMWYDATGLPIPECNLQQTCKVLGATNNPGPGMLTFYWTNQQSGRLMFYHDHAYGITRLNVHAGEAAGYLLVNPPDEDALAGATVPGTIGSQFFGRTPAAGDPPATGADLAHMIPLVLQDKTFVPPLAQTLWQDPSWDPVKWGGEASIWYPHVYMTNQWPDNPDGSGTGPYGHWDYGPWFWPAQNQLTEVDAAGVAQNRPLTKKCLSSYPGLPAPQLDSDPTSPTYGKLWNTNCPTTPDPSAIPESFLDTPVINGIAYPTLTVEPAAYRFQILNAAQERNWNLSWFVADGSGTEVPMVPAVPHGPLGATAVSTTPPLCDANAPLSTATGLPFGPDLTGVPTCWPATWPTDSRQGGAPDPAAAGPKWIQVGSEAGILPAPATIPPTPVGYEQNKRNIVVLNVATKGLFMGPAERADVVVDFTPWAGKTLILYNDAPAPVPAGDTRLDTYTGDPDQTLSGGAPTTLPGYGPNIRTILQVKVAPARTPASASQPALDEGLVATALGQRFKLSQPPPIVPESAYTSLYGNGATFTNTYLPIQLVTSLTFTPLGETQPITVPIQNKTIQELFTLNYGRMNSLLGVEIPTSNFQNQTTIPFANYDPASDFFSDGEIQVWKITHNGVDTHTIHFHLVNLQVINRVGWDGQIRPPDANELGWKESVRMNPLEDIYVALKPVKQNLPWPLPDKWRPMDLTRPLGTASQFTQLDIFNQPITYTNQMANYGWEYVWHCHLLGHEEEDMLRAEVFVVAPETPSGLTVTQVGSQAQLTWTEQAKSTMQFTVQVSNDATFPAAATTSFVAYPPADQLANHLTVPGTPLTKLDPQTLDSTKTYFYRVRAEKTLTSPAMTVSPGGANAALQQFTAKSTWSNVAQLGNIAAIQLVAPANALLAFGNQPINSTSAPQTVTIGVTGGGIGIIPSFSGTNPGDFAVASNGCASAVANCNITVTFTPAAAGARSATLVLTPTVGTAITVGLTGTGTAPAASLNPTTLAFVDQFLGTSSPAQTFQVLNTGTADLTVTGVVLAGVDATQFTITSNTCVVAPATTGKVAPNATCTVGVAFAPTTVGAKSARVAVTSNDPTNPTLNVTLSGNGVVSIASVTPASLSFTADLNTLVGPSAVTVTNGGTAPLAVGSLIVGGANATDYALVNDTCTGATVGIGGSCSFGVTFRPPSGLNQPRVGTVTIPTNDPAHPTLTVSLSGAVLVPSPAVTPTSLSFATQTVGTTSAGQNVVLSNSGPAGATLGIASIVATNDFAVSVNGCGASLAGASTCTISVTFTPTVTGTRSGTLTITPSDTTLAPLIVTLTGTGSVVSLSPTTLAFGDQLVGTTSASRTVTLVNAGTTALTINGASITGTNPTDFTVANNCGTTLNAGRSCTLSVRFTPTATGARSATLNVSTSDPSTPTVALTGNGTMPTYTLTDANNAVLINGSVLNLGKAAVGTTVANAPTQTVTLTNGPVQLGIRGISIGGNNASSFQLVSNSCPAVVAPNGTCAFTIAFTPTRTGTRTATVTLRAQSPAASTTLNLTGSGF